MVDVSERWQSPATAESYDADRFSGLLGRLLERRQRRALGRCLADIGAVSALADLPTGTGRMLPLLGQYAEFLIACDASDAMMQHAKARMAGHQNTQYLLCDARDIPLPGGSVDAVVSVRFFMHLAPEQRLCILSEFARVSRRWVVVEYGCDSRWHRLRRGIRSLLLRLAGRGYGSVRSVPWSQILDEAGKAGLVVRRRFHTLPGFSESVFVVMERLADEPGPGSAHGVLRSGD